MAERRVTVLVRPMYPYEGWKNPVLHWVPDVREQRAFMTSEHTGCGLLIMADEVTTRASPQVHVTCLECRTEMARHFLLESDL